MKRSVILPLFHDTNDPNLHIFEYDKSASAKLCIISTFDAFLTLITDQHDVRTWNEHINRDKPCRMYLDCELKGLESDDAMPPLLEYVAAIHAEVSACVRGFGEIDPPIVLVGSRSRVFSVHLVWASLWCETTDPILAIATFLHDKRIMGVDVDKGVYPTKSGMPCTLRMPYCEKLADRSAGPIHPLGGPPVFDSDTFCKSLLTFHSQHSQAGAPLPVLPARMLSITDLSLEIGSLAKRARVDGDGREQGDADKSAAMRWFDLTTPGFRPSGFSVLGQGGWSCYASMYCVYAERWHKNNSTYVNCDPRGVITFSCSDAECRKQIPHPVSEHEYIIAEKPWSVDMDILKRII